MMIDAGTTFEAGCTPDGACWTDFVSHRACEVRFMDKLPRNYKGFDFSSARGCVVWVLKHPAGNGWSNPKDRWTIEKVIAHEVGHDNCATVHRDGERWCRK